jgi:hypothetical protein
MVWSICSIVSSHHQQSSCKNNRSSNQNLRGLRSTLNCERIRHLVPHHVSTTSQEMVHTRKSNRQLGHGGSNQATASNRLHHGQGSSVAPNQFYSSHAQRAKRKGDSSDTVGNARQGSGREGINGHMGTNRTTSEGLSGIIILRDTGSVRWRKDCRARHFGLTSVRSSSSH